MKNDKKDLSNYQESSNFTIQVEKDKEMKKAPIVDESKLGENPYLYTLEIPVTRIISNVDHTETAEGVMVNKTFYCEKTQKVELYMHESARSNVAGLSDKAKSLYLHVLYSLQRNQEWLYLNKVFYMKENRVASPTTYYEAVKELQRYSYIQKTIIKEVYWINPHRFFPGNRVVKYPDKIKVSATWDRSKNKQEPIEVQKKKPFKMNKNG